MAIAQQEKSLSTMLAGRWDQASRKVVSLAEMFPAGEIELCPAAGARTLGGVLRHVAFWNQYVADFLRGQAADDTGNELPSQEYATKADIVQALKHASQEASAALRERKSLLDSEAVELVLSFIEHTSEHYGQMVVYARMAGIVPPASHT